MQYSELLIEQIKDRINIIDIARERIKDIKEQHGNLMACCPFHTEKTPSFSVSESRQCFKCFGCGEGGDVIELVVKLDGISFPEAVRRLADRAGINVEGSSLTEEEENKLKEQHKTKKLLLRCNNIAAEYYHKKLNDYAKKYLFDRGINEASLTDWQIGLAPDKGLKQHLADIAKDKARLAIESATNAGLIGTSKDGFEYERFRNRITFPICDISGNVTGYTCRLPDWTKESKTGKYINSNQSAVFDKSKTLYGLDKAAESIRKEDSAIIVEGCLDVIMMHQKGFSNTVATLGTALTESHIKILKRFCSSVTVLFDGDEAGWKAAEKAVGVALQNDIEIKVGNLHDKDPAELLSAGYIEDLKSWIYQSVDGFEWLLDCKFNDITSSAKITAIARQIIKIIANCKDSLSSGLYLKTLSDRSGLSIHELKKELKGTKRSDPPRAPQEGASAPTSNRTGTADDWLSSEVADRFIKLSSGRIIYFKDEFYRHTGKCYKQIPLGQMRAEVLSFIKQEGYGKPTINFANNVMGNISAHGVIDYDYTPPSWLDKAPFDKNNTANHLVSLNNGILDINRLIKTKENNPLTDHNDNLFSLIALPYNYNPEAKADEWQELLDTVLPDWNLQYTLQEWFGYCLLPTQKFQKILLMVGEGANGKSVITDVLKQMIGAANCSALPIETLDKPHSTVSLVGKLVNFSSEFTRNVNESEGIIKMITGGDEVEINPKHRAPYSMPLHSRMVITSNNPPKISDRSDGLWRRLIILPFNIQIAADKQRNKDELVNDICKDLPGIINWALVGLQRLLERDRFTETDATREAKEEYRQDSNSARAFCDENLEPSAHGWLTKESVYKQYSSWVKEEGLTYTFPQRDFGKEVVKWSNEKGIPNILGRKSIDNKRVCIYEGVDYVTDDIPYEISD